MELPSSWKVIVFTINLLVGLAVSQVAGATFPKDVYKTWMEIIIALTMWCLSFIMINVGYEFTIDKKALGEYGWDYLIAMTAAGFPWLFAALWFFFALGTDIPMSEALLVARFSAPTSAGILFSMLDAAGLKDTWLFQKARILAIFDDLDTILLMIPLKVVLVGFKWELIIVVGIMVFLLALAWFKLHAYKLPHSWPWSLFYAAIIALVCKMLHVVTHYHIKGMESIHIEVLLPAFVLGTIIDTPCARHELELQRKMSEIRRSMTLQRKSSRLEAANAASRSGDIGTNSTTTTPVTPIRQAPGKELVICDDASKSILPVVSKPAERLPGTTANENVADDDGLETIFVDASPQDTNVASRVASLPEETPAVFSSEDHNVISPQANGWTDEKEKQLRSISKQSKGSNRSTTSSASSLTRYGHSRNDVHRSKTPPDAAGKPKKKSLEPEAEPDPGHDEGESEWEVVMQTAISMVFMVLVGLSMPALIGKNAKDNSGGLSAGTIVLHVFCVTILMIAGKMFPAACYRDEAPLKQRIALCIGMCPRGEVGASIIVISLELGVEGPAIIIAMCALGGNLVMSGGFIGAVKYLLRGAPSLGASGGEQVVQTA